LNGEESAKVTVSIGIYCIQNVAEESPTQILKRADQALFIAITNGRNKSVLYANASSSSHQN
jgi:diguanylate cyclase (GGDEF)-like protein